MMATVVSALLVERMGLSSNSTPQDLTGVIIADKSNKKWLDFSACLLENLSDHQTVQFATLVFASLETTKFFRLNHVKNILEFLLKKNASLDSVQLCCLEPILHLGLSNKKTVLSSAFVIAASRVVKLPDRIIKSLVDNVASLRLLAEQSRPEKQVKILNILLYIARMSNKTAENQLLGICRGLLMENWFEYQSVSECVQSLLFEIGRFTIRPAAIPAFVTIIVEACNNEHNEKILETALKMVLEFSYHLHSNELSQVSAF